MLKRLTNKLTMYVAVQSLLNQDKALWEEVPAVATVVATLETLLGQIDVYKHIADENNKGITLEKASQQGAVIARTYELASALYVLASQTKDVVLAAKVKYTETDLLKMRDGTLVLVCLNIADLAAENLNELEPYQVTENEVRSLKEAITAFSDNLPATRVSVSEKKAANMMLKELFVQTDALLKNQMDRLMVRFRKTQPRFYDNYRNLRHVINYGVRHKKPKEGEKEE